MEKNNLQNSEARLRIETCWGYDDEMVDTERKTGGETDLRERFRQTGVSGQALDILMTAWKDGTQAQYQGYLKQWRSFCMGRDIDMFTPQVSEVFDFLTTLFDKGLGYSALNTARSSLSSVINIEGRSVGEHKIVKFMKGVFNFLQNLGLIIHGTHKMF